MSRVDFKKWQRVMSSALIFPNVPSNCLCPLPIFSPCRMSLCFVSLVEFKKWPCLRASIVGFWSPYIEEVTLNTTIDYVMT